MGKHDFLTPKAIGIRIKAKGLQKLRWFCQVCQKQCRDENGFKCHTTSESHQRQMLIVANNPNKFMSGYSEMFESAFLENLRRRHGTKRMRATHVYNEYIADKLHIHMNATQWTTLGGFVQYLGRTGKCVVDETEKGWHIQYIDRDPKAIARQEELAKKKKAELDHEERNRLFIERQLKIATEKEVVETQFQPTKLQRGENGEKITLMLAGKKEIVKKDGMKAAVFKVAGPNGFEDTEKLAHESGEVLLGKRHAVDVVMEEDERRRMGKRKQLQDESKRQRKENWITTGIVVKVTNKKVGNGVYFKCKGVVKDVQDKFCATVELLDSGDVLRLDQDDLETVIPRPGSTVKIVNGLGRGYTAELLDVSIDDFCARIRIDSGSHRGAQEVIELFSSSSDEASSIEEEKIQFQSHRRHFKRSNAGHDRNSGSSMSDSSQSSFTIDKGTQSLLRLQRSRQFVAVKMAKVASMRRPRYDEGMQEITEGMNYQELQAQQKMLERLQTQNRRKFYQNGKEKKLEKKEIFKEAKEMSLMKTRSHMHVIKGRQLTSRVEKVDNETKETDAEWAIFLEKAAQRKAARRQKEVEDARSLKKARNKIQHTVPLHANCDHELKKKSKKKLKRKFQTQQNAVKCTTSGRKLRKTLKKNLQKSSSDEDFEVENDLEKQEQSEKNKSDEEEREPTSLQRRKKRHQESEKHRRPYTAAPVSIRQRIDVEMAAESEVDAETTTLRSNRTIETHLIKEKLTFLELQEQEKLMAFFKAQKRRRRPLMSLIGNCNDTGSASGQDDENDVAKFTKAKSMHVAQTNGVAKTAFDAPTNSVARRARMGVSETPEATSTLSGIASPLQNGFLVSNKNSLTVAHAKSSKKLPNPVIHSTAWRRLMFKIAPANILDVSTIPYAADFDRPLWDYDRSKKLRTKCSLVDTKCVDFVSRKKQFKKQPQNESITNCLVRNLIQKELPRIKTCHLRRVRHVLQETRKQLSTYFHSHQVVRNERYRKIQWSEFAHHQTWLDVSSIERITAKRKLQQYPQTNLPYNSLVGDVQYWIYRNKCPHDFHVYPETVAYLPNEISAICRSFTMIGIRKNVFVEDDPILTYVPYLGDGERLVIENNLYTATTIGKERRMAEFGEGEELKEHTRSCRESDIDECLLRVVVNICGGREQAFKALEQEGGMQRPRLDYDELIASNKTKARIASQITKVKECINSSANKAVNPACQALRRLSTKCWFLQDSMNLKTLSLPMKLQPPVSVFESNYGQSPEALGLRDRTTFDGISEWYRDLFCRRCFIYDCIEHGIQNPQRRQREDPVYPMMTVPSLMHIRHELVDLDNETDHQKIKLMTSSNVDEIVELCLSSSDDEVQETTSLQSRTAQRPIAKYRRSRRTQTRISSLATNSLITQEKMVESERLAKLEKRRKRRKQFRQSADNSEYLDNSYLPAVALRMKTLASKTHPCGSCCWIGANPNESISCQQVDTILVRKIASALGPNACVIAAILKSPSCTCANIWRLLTKDLKRQERGEQLSTEVASSAEKQRKKGRQSAEAGVTCPIVPRVRNAELSTERERKVSFKPCNHDGLCDVACGCMERGHACNRTCSCSRDCRNRFQGCKCFVGNCHTSACPCWSAGRECDPDFCFTCGASDAAVVAFHALGKSWGSNQLRLCHNVNMLLGSIQKNVCVSFSSTHGWGAFALEPISKDDFVLEYTGELISDEEAERRGAMYDRKSISYLFGVNSEYVVDAARKGNKAKFANHKAKKKANLDVRIIVSNGEHRIGLFANETIEIGAELFFDYGYTHDSAPTWSQHHKPISEKGVYAIVDEENEWEQWE